MLTRKRLASTLAIVILAASSAEAGPPPSKATKVEFDKAQGLFEKSKDLMQKGKLEEALAGFNKSYDVVASPISKLFAARCLHALGRHLESHRAFSDAMFEAAAEAKKDAKYGETRAAAETERGELAGQVALVTVRLEEPGATGEVTIAGVARPAERLGDPFAVPPGTVEVVLMRNGQREAQTLQVGVGERKEALLARTQKVAVAPPPPPPTDDGAARRKNLRIASYVAGGIGVVGLGVFAYEGSKARSRYDDLKSQCGGGPCPADKADEVSAGRRETKLANIGLAVGVVGVAAGATLFVVSREPRREPSTTVAVGPGMLTVKGTFR